VASSPGYYGSRPKSTDSRRAMVVRKFWAGGISDRLAAPVLSTVQSLLGQFWVAV
jgi:hypothetical protein